MSPVELDAHDYFDVETDALELAGIFQPNQALLSTRHDKSTTLHVPVPLTNNYSTIGTPRRFVLGEHPLIHFDHRLVDGETSSESHGHCHVAQLLPYLFRIGM